MWKSSDEPSVHYMLSSKQQTGTHISILCPDLPGNEVHCYLLKQPKTTNYVYFTTWVLFSLDYDNIVSAKVIVEISESLKKDSTR